MAVPTGTASLLDIQNEFGGSNPISLSEYRGVGPGPASGAISINNFRGASNVVYLTGNHKQITASSYVSAGGTLDISSSSYIWSDSTAVAAIIIDIACTIINNGKIMGKGGDGGLTQGQGGTPGGPAINVTASGVTITNNSGAYIAGGGGGGGGTRRRSGQWSGGGGGAGGGRGGGSANYPYTVRAGGAIGQKGQDMIGWSAGYGGGEAGGQGAYDGESSSGSDYGRTAGGGGRILPGTATPGAGAYSKGGAGGEQGGPGAIFGNDNLGPGGGGWGAAGGNSTYSGGAAGAAITGTSRTLTNNGTVYGGT
jgi:hypothetical protein